MLVKGLHYGCPFEPECHDISKLVEKAIFNDLQSNYNYTSGLEATYSTLKSSLCTNSWYCNEPRDAIIDPNIIVMENSKLWHWTNFLQNLRKISPEMLYKKAWQDNNGYIENTMLPFLLDEDVIPSLQLGLKHSIDYKSKDNNSFIEENIDYDTAWLIWKTWIEVDASSAPTAEYT